MIVISRIVGGIGNQLFQYAAARAFSDLYNADLFLDLSTFSHPKYFAPEGFLINKVFQKDVPFATSLEYDEVLGLTKFLLPLRFKIKYEKICNNYFVEKNVHKVEEKFFLYDKKHCYMEGYWQSEKYFQNISEKLNNELDFDFNNLESSVLEMSHMLRDQPSVSIHVRRGDYVTNKVFKEIFVQCDEAYYEGSIRSISNRVPNAKFFVFSDDIEWAKAQPVFRGCSFVSGRSNYGSWNDLFLMSCCQHNIIANSSFSWWGAWLNKNVRKIVIAPKRWFNGVIETPDRIPEDWEIL